MENANPPLTNNRHVLPAALHAKVVRELHELHVISALVDSRLESIEQFLNSLVNQPNETDMNDLESDDESVDTPLVSPFPHSDNDSDDSEVLNELSEYENARVLRRERIINSFDGDDLAFQCMIGFRKFTAYFDPFLPMNIISCKAYNIIMVEGLEGTGKNLVAIVRDVYVFVRSFTYITDFMVLEDIGESIVSDMVEVLMGKPFRKITKLKYSFAKGLVSFTKIFDTYIFRMPRIIPRLRNFNWSKIPPLLELSQQDLTSGLRHPYENNKLMYKNFLNLGPEYQADESMKEWLIHGHDKLTSGDKSLDLSAFKLSRLFFSLLSSGFSSCWRSYGAQPLTFDFNTFCSSIGFDYNNGKYVAHPIPEVLGRNYSSTEQVNSIQQLLAYCLITRTEVDIEDIIYSDLVTKLLNKSRLKYVSYPRFISCALQVLLGSNYTQDENFGFLPGILTKEREISNCDSNLTQVTGPEASEALSKKRQKPKSKKPPTETKVTPPKLMEGSEQSYSVSSGTVPDPQDLERNIQLASTGFPSTLDEGTRKTSSEVEPDTKPLQLQTFTNVQAFLLSEDELDKESDKEEVLVTREDMDEDPQVTEEIRTPSPKQDQPKPSHVQESTSDSSSPDLKKFDNILPLNERQLIKYLRKMSRVLFKYYDENIAHIDQTNKLVESTMSTIDMSSTTIKDLYQGLNVINKLLKDISTVVKDDPPTNKKIDEAIKTFAKISTNTTEVLFLVKDFDFSTLQSTMKDLQAHALKQEETSAA
ncbi:hypothetical protein Tco_0115578 [Tanacetum coccineum]